MNTTDLSAAPGPQWLVHRPAHGQPPTLLFILAAGLQTPAEALEPVMQALVKQFPGAALVLAQWQGSLWEGAFQHQDWTLVQDSLRQLREHWNFAPEQLALVGEKEGATLFLETALHAAALSPPACVAGRILAFGGGFVARPHLALPGTCVHMMAARSDPHLHVQHWLDAAQTLVDLEGDITADLLPDLQGALDPALIQCAMDRLTTYLPRRLWQEALSAGAPEAAPPDATRS